MTILHAITRNPSASMVDCELTYFDREPIDPERLQGEHARYVELLRELGYEVQELDEESELPDAVFVEDTAIVLDEVAVITRPGARSRRPETESIARALEPWRALKHMLEPGTLDGGDVLRLGRTLYVGLSSRSNEAGVRQLAECVAPHGYTVRGVEVGGCLHLKSAACPVAEDALLCQVDWVDPGQFGDVRIIPTDPGEPGAANVVWLGEDAIYSAAFPLTAAKLEAFGLRVHALDYGELAKAEGGVTCCSLLFSSPSE